MAWFHRLREPSKGDRITADWARELVRAVRSLRLSAGPGIRLTRTPEGTTVSAATAATAAPRTPHYGVAEDAEEIESWSVADGRPAILGIDMAGTGEDDPPRRVKILVDSRGNVIGWNAGEDPEDPEAPEKPSAPPPCGNPLNETPDDYHPLSGGGGSASGEDEGEDDDHPLNHEGPGGFTPACGDP